MFDWRDYLGVARYLSLNAIATGTEEAAHRSAVSRAYYATYCLVRGWATEQSPQPFLPSGSVDDHRRLRDWLRVKHLVPAAHDLQVLRDLRNRCDYDDTVTRPVLEMSQNAVRIAESVLLRLGIT